MAIKYNTKVGAEHLNLKARYLRDYVLKPKLSGMKCKNCGGDSEFTFHQHQGYVGSGSVDWEFNTCCPFFEKEVYAKLGVNS